MKKLKQIPQTPGVYQMLDKEGNIIYVGKAKNLRKRIKSYFQKKDHGIRIQKMVEKIENVKWTETESELEALILETNMIKELRPRYNIAMRDDKSFVYAKISTNEDFPRITITRKVLKDGAKYFGPVTASHKVEKTFKILRKVLPFRTCTLDIKCENEKAKVTKKTIKYPCLDHYIKRCISPCVSACTPEEYKKIATFDQFKGTNSGIPFSTLIRDIGQIRFWPGGRVTLNWCTWDGNKLSRRETTRLIEIDEALVPRFMCLYELRNAHLLSQLDPGEDLLPAAFELVEHEGPVYGRLVPSEKPGARILVSLTSTSVNRMGMSTGGYYAIPEIEGVVATPCGITTDSVPLDGVVSSHFVLEISLDCAPFQFSTWSLQYKKADQRWCHMENTHLRCTDR